jgi:hypothetical protein
MACFWIDLATRRAKHRVLCSTIVQVPKKSTREQRRMFEELVGVLPVDNAPHEKSVFERERDFFG